MLLFGEASGIVSKPQEYFDEFQADAGLFDMICLPFLLRVSRSRDGAQESKGGFFGLFAQGVPVTLGVFLNGFVENFVQVVSFQKDRRFADFLHICLKKLFR